MKYKRGMNPNSQGNRKGFITSEETKRKIRLGNKGKVLSKETREKIKNNNSKYWLGKNRSEDTIIKIRNANIGRTGEKSANWKGGITPINSKIRNSEQYEQWRKSVFERDNFTCQNCGKTSGNGTAVYLEAHHIKTFSLYPELRFEPSNGLTLCEECHNLTKKGRPYGFEYIETMNELREIIKNDEGHCVQQVAFSTFHNALTQINFTKRIIRSNIKI